MRASAGGANSAVRAGTITILVGTLVCGFVQPDAEDKNLGYNKAPAQLLARIAVLNTVVLSLLAALAAYLIGSLSFAVIVSSVMGLNDPRTYGSGNPGATNVLRSGSKAAAAVTLLLDALKGLLPVLLVKCWGEQWGLGEAALAMVAIAAFLGHLFPVFFKFKGGKGVATALGVLLGISGWFGLMILATWLVVAATTRYSSLSALIAAVLAPVYYVLFGGAVWDYSKFVLLAVVVMSALLLWRHAGNISRLLKGQESKIGSEKDKAAQSVARAKNPKRQK